MESSKVGHHSPGRSRFRPAAGPKQAARAAVLAFALLAAGPLSAEEADMPVSRFGESQALPVPELTIGQAMRVLGDDDADLYSRIFDLQKDGKFKTADKLIGQLSDRILMGHVLYQRYMHPRAYRAQYRELKDWMAAYADHPGADRVYRLAVKRRPDNWLWPQKPRSPTATPGGEAAAGVEDWDDDSREARRYSRNLAYAQARIRRWLRMGAPTRALQYLNTKSVARHFDDVSFDEALADIGGAYFQYGKDEKALETAGRAAARSGSAVPEGHWWAGLAAWRLGRHDVAAEHFSALARSGDEYEWLASAGAYWAARAYLVTRQPNEVVPMLQLAAQHPLTFYGVLAQEALALRHSIDWSVPAADAASARDLLRIPAARRGIALLEAGQESLALAEFKRIVKRLEPNLLEALMAFADEQQFAALAYQTGNAMHRREGHWHGAALYPLPAYTPSNGFQIDRALIYALMRQESNFKVTAKSHAGARGLMQLMPGTAGFISGRRFRGWRRNQLYDPELNVTLGQKYIRYLLEKPSIDGNLFMAVAAYNGGPGNLRKWLREIEFGNDPLLFIESIPRRETRVYVERVLANYWLYRDRLGQPRPSLENIVAGDWPVYSALDPLNRQVALTPSESEARRDD